MRPTVAAILLLSACRGAEQRPPFPDCPGPAPPAQKRPLVTEMIVPRSDLKLLPGDLLLITVRRQPDLETQRRIAEDGKISFPLIGPVEASGKTQAEVERMIGQRLERDYLKNASVTVTVKEYAKRDTP